MEYNKKAVWGLICLGLIIVIIIVWTFVSSYYTSTLKENVSINVIIYFLLAYYSISIVGLILGFKSKKEIKINNQKGSWMAILNIVLNIIFIVAPIIIFIVIIIAFASIDGPIY